MLIEDPSGNPVELLSLRLIPGSRVVAEDLGLRFKSAKRR
jgi:hypothetical protein